MNMNVRLAATEDKPEWLRMRLLLWPEVGPAELSTEMDQMLQDALTPVFVLERPEGGLGGFLEAGTRKFAEGCITTPVGYIEGWFVDDDLRGRGFGHQLVRAAEDWARSQGLKEMGSDTWLGNEGSIRAHLAMGYHETERVVHFAKTL